MDNKEMKKNIPVEIEDDTLDEVSGGLITDSVNKDDATGVPAILTPFDGYSLNSL